MLSFLVNLTSHSRRPFSFVAARLFILSAAEGPRHLLPSATPGSADIPVGSFSSLRPSPLSSFCFLVSAFSTPYPLSSHILAHCFALFCTCQKINSFVFNQFRTLRAKHPGVGVPRLLSHCPPAPYSVGKIKNTLRQVFYFLRLAKCPSHNSFVLIMIHLMGGCTPLSQIGTRFTLDPQRRSPCD